MLPNVCICMWLRSSQSKLTFHLIFLYFFVILPNLYMETNLYCKLKPGGWFSSLYLYYNSPPYIR